jgi:adenylate cyclase
MRSWLLGRDPDTSNAWHAALTTGYRPMALVRAINRVLPGSSRCKFCYRPFDGISGRLASLAGFRRSRKNPQMCDF